jgi:Flp pilus assembly pilin Flp
VTRKIETCHGTGGGKPIVSAVLQRSIDVVGTGPATVGTNLYVGRAITERRPEGKEMQNLMSRILKAVRDEEGAEMVEWIVVVAVLATVAAIVFGPGGILSNAMNNGVNHIANIVNNAS